MAFIAVVFTDVPLMAVAPTAMAPAAVDDSYSETVYRDSAAYNDADSRC
jgi:hypothetical protein